MIGMKKILFAPREKVRDWSLEVWTDRRHAEGSETQDGLVYCRWLLAQKMSIKPIEIIITIIDYYVNQSINRNNMKINQ